MNTPKWGRKETIIFPSHSPVYTYGAVFFALILTGMFVYLRFSRGQTPLQQFLGIHDSKCGAMTSQLRGPPFVSRTAIL
ncbi:MAG: hypothetical protein JSS95_06835 [Acidobacteria bacterium]|nr:hypothetical protein [Acidobacteriota bacterium]